MGSAKLVAKIEESSVRLAKTCKYHNKGLTKKNIKNLSNKELTNDQINVGAEELKFIPTPVTKQTQIKRQPLHDFDRFVRRMWLMYIIISRGKQGTPSLPCQIYQSSTTFSSPWKLLHKKCHSIFLQPEGGGLFQFTTLWDGQYTISFKMTFKDYVSV